MTLPPKRRFWQAAAASLIGFLIVAVVKPAFKRIIVSEKTVIQPQSKLIKITDTRVVTGKIVDCQRNELGIELKLKCKDDIYDLQIPMSTDIVSHFPRTEHNVITMVDYIKKNPDCNCMVGVRKGVVLNVIMHPAEIPSEQSQPSPE